MKNRITKQLQAIAIAIAYFTRIPIANHISYSPEGLKYARQYFPLIGWINGTISSLVFVVSSYFLSNEIGVLLTLLSGTLLTGALHEDGLADTCDALGGGSCKASIMRIMHDSTLGVYGTIAIVTSFTFRFVCLYTITQKCSLFLSVALIVAANSVSRLMVSHYFFTHTVTSFDVPNDRFSIFFSDKCSYREVLVASFIGILPYMLTSRPIWLMTLIPVYLGKTYFCNFFAKKLDGYTGDTLGATQQICEIIFYMTCVFILRFELLY